MYTGTAADADADEGDDSQAALHAGRSEASALSLRKAGTPLPRVVLRERGRTIAAGLVVEKPADKDKS